MTAPRRARSARTPRATQLRELVAAQPQVVEVEVAHAAPREEARGHAALEHLAARTEQRRLGSELAAEVDQLVLVAARAVQQQQRRRAAARLEAVDERLDAAHSGSGRHARMSGSGVSTGSMRSRRCSNAGGSERCSPSDSSGSSTVKPGPSVAISKSTPPGSRK